MAKTTTTSLSEGIMSYYESLLLEMLKPMLVLYEDAVKKPLPKNKGLTVTFMRYQQFGGPELLTEGTAPTAASLSAENVSTKIFQLGKHTVLTDLIETATIDPVVENATMVLTLAARKAVDQSIGRMLLWRRTSLSATLGIGAGAGFGLSGIGQLSSTEFEIPLIRNGTGNCNILALSGIAASSTLTVTLLRQARKYLEGMDCPTFPDGTLHGVTHPDALNVLTATSGWIDFNKYTNTKPLTGEVGKVQNVRFKTSTNMPVSIGSGHPLSTYGGNTVHFTYVYGPLAYGVTEISNLKGRLDGAELKIKTSGKQSITDPLDQNPHTIGYKITHAVKVLNNSCIIGILTGQGDDSLIPV